MTLGASELPAGTRFQSASGLRSGTVGALLGEGGQGSVYRVDIGGHPFALKWYHDYYVDIDTGLRNRLSQAVQRGAPDGRFLWPLDLVRVPGQKSFGYVMPLRDEQYIGMRELIAPPPKRVVLSLEERARLCGEIADGFLQLHASGFCYQDINFGNIFLNPKTATVLICDNDNVNIDGAEASIYGTRRFMAPEVVRRETLPNTNTDLFSMAVLFFYIVFGWHPLDGRREAETRILDDKAEHRLYGTEPLFIFDPYNSENGPVDGLHDAIVYRWNSLGEELRDLFIRSFTVGLFSPLKRVHEYEWRGVFRRAGSAVFQCEACGYEHVALVDSADALGPTTCAYCGADPKAPALLKVGKQLITLNAGRVLDRALLDAASDVRARVDVHPERADILGLRNLGEDTWRTEIPGYSATPIGPGKTVRLMHGLSLELADRQGRVINPADNGR